jgi:hypothetical protein
MDSRKSSSECLLPVSTPDTSTCSHSMGRFSALKISLTDSDTSAPIPSPAMRVKQSGLDREESLSSPTWDQRHRVLAAELGRLLFGEMCRHSWLGVRIFIPRLLQGNEGWYILRVAMDGRAAHREAPRRRACTEKSVSGSSTASRESIERVEGAAYPCRLLRSPRQHGDGRQSGGRRQR